MSLIKRIAYTVRALTLGGAVTSVCLFFNILQILSLPLLPWTRRWNLKMSSMMAGFIWWMLQYTFEGIHHMPISFSGDEIPYGESAIVFSNHVSFSDWLLIHSVSIRRGMVANGKYFAKDSLKWLPAFGWGMWMLGFIFIKRSWTDDKDTIEQTFSRIRDLKIPVWLVSFLEGTRIRPHKLVESQNFAKKRGDLPILNNVLLPRTKGFTATVQAMRGSHVKAVYDFTLCYLNKKKGFGIRPSLFRVHSHDLEDEYTAHVHVRRYLIEDLPTSDEELSKWVQDRYVEKDAVLQKLRDNWSEGLKSLDARREPEWRYPILDFKVWDNELKKER